VRVFSRDVATPKAKPGGWGTPTPTVFTCRVLKECVGCGQLRWRASDAGWQITNLDVPAVDGRPMRHARSITDGVAEVSCGVCKFLIVGRSIS
jgi:hypothetical protein